MSKEDIRIKVTFGEEGSAPELEVITPLHSTAGIRMWAALASLRINPLSAYLVRTDTRLIAHVKLAEYNGAPLAQHRATEAMGLLRERLCDAYDSESKSPPRFARIGLREQSTRELPASA
jgi:hypothetical protein